MRTCNRFHLDDIERGDVFDFELPEDERDDLDLPRKFRGTVSSIYNSHNFGPIFHVTIGDSYKIEDVYYYDGWKLTYVNPNLTQTTSKKERTS